MYRATFPSTLQKCGIIVMDLLFSKQTNKRNSSLNIGNLWTNFNKNLAHN